VSILCYIIHFDKVIYKSETKEVIVMTQENVLIALINTIKKNHWCFQHGGSCHLCSSHKVTHALKMIPREQIEQAFLEINEDTPDIEKMLEPLQRLFSYFHKRAPLENVIDVDTISKHWSAKSNHSPECIYALLLNRKMLQKKLHPSHKHTYPCDFDGRGKYHDSEEETMMRQGWYER